MDTLTTPLTISTPLDMFTTQVLTTTMRTMCTTMDQSAMAMAGPGILTMLVTPLVTATATDERGATGVARRG